MNIWCIASPPFGKLNGGLFSPLASIRLRCLEVAPELVRLGHEVTLVPANNLADKIALNEHENPDVVIVYKVLEDICDQLAQIRAAGKRIIVDITEHVLANTRSGDNSKKIVEYGDVVTVSSLKLRDLLGSITKQPVHFIEDCVEGPMATVPAKKPSDMLNLLWFGRSVNLDPLYEFLSDPKSSIALPPTKLRIVTDSDGVDVRRLGKNLDVELLEWSPAALRDQLAWSHAAVFPSAPSELYQSKSSNRLQQTLWQRRLPIGVSKDGYSDFLEFGLFGDRLEDILLKVIPEWDVLMTRVDAGWQEVARKFVPATVASKWHALIVQPDVGVYPV